MASTNNIFMGNGGSLQKINASVILYKLFKKHSWSYKNRGIRT